MPQRPPFTGIDEISSNTGGNTPHEGGGDLPPYGEDVFQRIVDVNWAASGGVFVSGDFCCYQRYTRLPDNKTTDFAWIGLGPLDFGDSGGTESSTYALANGKPTFLLGGHRATANGNRPCLMLSNDGFTWTRMQAGDVMLGHSIERLVWDADEKLFYAATDDIRPYYSPDGVYWFFSYSDFESHCKGILQGFPDGVYGYDKKNDVVIYPSEFGEAVAIVDASTFDAEEFTIWTGLDFVGAVNYTGGIWMAGGGAGGGSATVTSLDGGGNWFYSTVGDLGMNGDFDVATLIGGPTRDFRNVESAPDITPGAEGTLARTNARLGRKGAPHASRSQRPGLGIMAAAISAPRRPGPRLRRAVRPV